MTPTHHQPSDKDLQKDCRKEPMQNRLTSLFDSHAILVNEQEHRVEAIILITANDKNPTLTANHSANIILQLLIKWHLEEYQPPLVERAFQMFTPSRT